MHECPEMRYLAQVYKWSGQTNNYDNINGPTQTIYVVINGLHKTVWVHKNQCQVLDDVEVTCVHN